MEDKGKDEGWKWGWGYTVDKRYEWRYIVT